MIRMTLLTVLIAFCGLDGASRWAIAEPDPIDRLIRDATSGSTTQRLQAVEALGQSGDLRALQPLLDLLHDVDPSIRQRALDALQTLTQSLRQLYTHLAQWIDHLLLRLNIYLAPEPPIERTQLQRMI
jgi:HEAT repeat protein